MNARTDPQAATHRADAARLRADLLAWYDRHARALPWRVGPGERAAGARPDPYRVWLSEIMLQQTTAVFVAERFGRFLEKWPDLEALAAAELDEILTEWAGLGYYARARNLHKCAGEAAARGGFPADIAALRALPGVGDYTAAAVAAIAFDLPVLPVDANIERVIARVEAVSTPLPAGKVEIRAAAARWAEGGDRPGDLAQGLMDLGAAVCKPRAPVCMICPIRAHCRAFARGEAERYPVKAPKRERPHRRGAAFWLVRDGHVLLRRNPERGLLGGMVLPPGSDWRTDWEEGDLAAPEVLRHAPVAADWRRLDAQARHVFTHFALTLDIWVAPAPPGFRPGADEIWADMARLEDYALPGLGRKIAALAMARRGGER